MCIFQAEFTMFTLLIVLLKACSITSVDLDYFDCGVDESLSVSEGEVKITAYPWLGVLYYSYQDLESEKRSTTTVALIHREFVIGAAADIGPMPKHDFRRKTRVLLGQDWDNPGRRVSNYILHPEYGETFNTVALVQLRDIVRNRNIHQLCPAPNTVLKNPAFYVVKMKEDLQHLQKEVIRVMHVPGKMCKDFYVAANLYSTMMRPPHVACAVSLQTNEVCVWNAGAALVLRDVWGRWQLLGVGVRGPGCGAPSRYLDMMSYLPWIEYALNKFQRVTITKINDQKYILRSGIAFAIQRYGDCDTEEMQQILYRENILLVTDNNQRQRMIYNLTLLDHVEFTCLTLSIINASASTMMMIHHYCDRKNFGKPCYFYKYSSFDLSVELQYSDSCWFEMVAYGWHKNLTLLDMQSWRWQEGASYDDFSLTQVEYRGPTYMTDYGFEPIDYGMWLPEYDLWTTTVLDNSTDETPPPNHLPMEAKTRSTVSSTKATFSKKKPIYKTTTKRT